MTHTIEKSSATQVAVIVRVPYAELTPLLPKAAEVISADIEIGGFRKGKAPYEVVKQKVGEFKILEEAARLHIRKHFSGILKEVEEKEFKERSFEPMGDPAIAITKLAPGEELEYKITLALLPPLTLPDYRAIARRVLAGKKAAEVTEEEVQSSLQWLRESRAKLVTVLRGAEKGDRAEIDFSATLGGVPLEGGESKNHPFVVGQGRFLPGFEEHLIGLKAGEEKTFTVAVPPGYPEKAIAGKVPEFRVKMNLVQERTLPEWNDEFVKSLGNFSSVADVEKGIRKGLRLEKGERERERLRMAMVERIAAETKAEIPEPLIRQELEKMVAELAGSISEMGATFPDYLSHIKKTAEDLKREWRPDAERRVKIALALREIARLEDIQPSDDEVQEAMRRTAEHRGIAQKDLSTLDREAFVAYNRGIARNEKVFALLEAEGNP